MMLVFQGEGLELDLRRLASATPMVIRLRAWRNRPLRSALAFLAGGFIFDNEVLGSVAVHCVTQLLFDCSFVTTAVFSDVSGFRRIKSRRNLVVDRA
jgi:hypothetical protein